MWAQEGKMFGVAVSESKPAIWAWLSFKQKLWELFTVYPQVAKSHRMKIPGRLDMLMRFDVQYVLEKKGVQGTRWGF